MVTASPEAFTFSRPVEGGISRWNPFDEFNVLRNRMDDFFAHGFGYTPLWRMLPNETFRFDPPVEIFETKAGVELYLAVPGFVPADIHVECVADSITIYGERKPLVGESEEVRKLGVVTGE